MDDKGKTREELIAELADMRLLIEKSEARQRHAEKALHEIQPQLQQAQKMETLGTLVAGVVGNTGGGGGP